MILDNIDSAQRKSRPLSANISGGRQQATPISTAYHFTISNLRCPSHFHIFSEMGHWKPCFKMPTGQNQFAGAVSLQAGSDTGAPIRSPAVQPAGTGCPGQDGKTHGIYNKTGPSRADFVRAGYKATLFISKRTRLDLEPQLILQPLFLCLYAIS